MGKSTAEPVFYFSFLEPPRKEVTLRFLQSQGKRLLIRRHGPPEAALTCDTDLHGAEWGGVREGIIGEFPALCDDTH